MRVCMLLRNTFVRDARVAREAAALAAAGHELTVLAVARDDLPATEARDGYTIERAIAGGPFAGSIVMQRSGGDGRNRLRPPLAVRMRDASLSARFARAARAHAADVYHAHDLPTLAAARAAARAHNARLVFDAHELYADLTGLGMREAARWRRAESVLIRDVDRVIVPSEARAEIYRNRYGIAPVVVMNCPPSTIPGASPLAALRRPGELQLVYAGGFTPNRGLETLVHAIEHIEDTGLVLAGWGPLESELRRAAGSRVTFLDPVSPEHVVTLVSGADIGVAPYIPVGLNNQLAAPNKLFEYMHAGLAIVASDLPDIARVVTQHRIGALFDATDAGSIATAVRAVRADLNGMRARAREAAGLYTWESQARTLVSLYETLSTLGAERA